MVTFQVNDMTCGHCASTIAKALTTVDKPARVEVDILQKLVRSQQRNASGRVGGGYPGYRLHAQEVKAELVPAAAPRAAAGCGCGCGPRKTAPVDAGQAAVPAAGSCCG